MRLLIERLSTWLCALSLLVACTQESETDGVPSTGSGFLLSLSDRPMLTEESATTRSIPAALEKPVAANFQLTILPQGSKQPIYSGSFTSDPIPAGAGSYTLTARCGSNPQLAWDTPYYEGTAEATVTEGRYAEVTIPCRVANALLSVRFSNPSLFEQLYSDYGVTIQNGEYALRLTPENQTKSAYFPTGEVPSVRFTATLLANGQEVSFSLDNDLSSLLPLEAGQHIILTLSASNAAFTIEKIEVVDTTIDETLPDSWLPCPKVSDFGAINYVETNDAPTGSVISYTASRPIQAMELTFHFEDPQYALYNKTFKLHELTDEERTQLSTIGLSSLPQFGTDTKGTFNFAPLISTLQTNAGTTTVNTITLRVKANNRWSDEKTTAISNQITVEKPEFSLNVPAYNVWTKEITANEIQVNRGNLANIKKRLVYQYSSDNGSTWIDFNNGTQQLFASVPSQKEYIVRAFYREGIESNKEHATLETPNQLPNSDMEEWWIEKKTKSSKTYYTFHPYSEGNGATSWWDTNNNKAQGGTIVGIFWYEGCFASCVSYTEDTHSGEKAALMYLSGCGDSYANTSGTYVGGAMVGSLFIGKYDGGIVQGHDFNSRPTKLKFWCKYKPYGTDAYKVNVSLLNQGETIADGTFEPTSSNVEDSDYYPVTLSLNYTNTKAKATAICVQFLASNNTNPDNKKYFAIGTTITYPVIGNWTVHMGSVLKIDDIELIYDK